MKATSLLCALILFNLLATTAQAIELKDVDRKINKEPKYKSQPYYVLLAFGQDAAKKVWLVLDDDTLYVDRNCNGDLTEASEKITVDVEATKQANQYRKGEINRIIFKIDGVEGTDLQLDFWKRRKDFVPKDEPKMLSDWRIEREKHGWENATLWRKRKDGIDAQLPVVLCQNVSDAQVCYLNGPRTFILRNGDEQVLKLGEKNVFSVCIGTQSLAVKNCQLKFMSPLTTTEVPAEFQPIANFEFPNKNKDKPAIKVEQKLDQRCCGDCFYCFMQLPDDADLGKAHVSVTFPDWKEGLVAPGLFEVPIVLAEKKSAEQASDSNRER
jgi:hypothetical protein